MRTSAVKTARPSCLPQGDLERSATPPSVVGLDSIPLRAPHVVHEVLYPEGADTWPQRLEELGFLPGERVEVLTRGQPGGDPLAVRVGHSMFALRRAEAACIRVRRWPRGEDAR